MKAMVVLRGLCLVLLALAGLAWCDEVAAADGAAPRSWRVAAVQMRSSRDLSNNLAPYRAQIQARAAENTVFIVHANAPANRDAAGSHGQSRVIAPDGNILREASMFGEETVIADLDLGKATGANAKKSLTRGPLRDWWEDGMKRVRIVE